MLNSWNPNSDDGRPLLNQIAEEFSCEYGHIHGLTIHGIGNCHGSTALGGTRCSMQMDEWWMATIQIWLRIWMIWNRLRAD
ncbi:MAG: hypothetical protein JW749_02535 [Sedimentisphaerales bacterium]|nr:hypothetical protein [Sedimentisphaerales bacterium]